MTNRSSNTVTGYTWTVTAPCADRAALILSYYWYQVERQNRTCLSPNLRKWPRTKWPPCSAIPLFVFLWIKKPGLPTPKKSPIPLLGITTGKLVFFLKVIFPCRRFRVFGHRLTSEILLVGVKWKISSGYLTAKGHPDMDYLVGSEDLWEAKGDLISWHLVILRYSKVMPSVLFHLMMFFLLLVVVVILFFLGFFSYKSKLLCLL